MAEDWLNKIRESQADFSEPEPEGLWAGIEAGLAAEDIGASAGMEPVRATDAGVSVGRTSREDSAVSRRRTVRWWWAALPAAAVAVLVLFLSVPGYRDASDDPLRTSAISELKSAAEPFDVVSREVESSCWHIRVRFWLPIRRAGSLQKRLRMMPAVLPKSYRNDRKALRGIILPMTSLQKAIR